MPSRNAVLGRDVEISDLDLINMYGCIVGSRTRIDRFVEIQRNSSIGEDCTIGSNVFICEGVTLENGVRLGPGVAFTNDRYPRSVTETGELMGDADWVVVPTVVRMGATIGANATLLCGITIGRGAVVGCGSTVTRDVPDGAVVHGVPARRVEPASHPSGPSRATTPSPSTECAL